LEYAIGLTVVILKVAVGLGFVIFVHELGHFAVAKLCGVKCEKFYLGFDIAGLKLCKFRWGETEYGIGILPLGGYVKMLGQEDNPAKLREEMERAKAGQQAKGRGGDEETGSPTAEPSSSTSSASESSFLEAAVSPVSSSSPALYDPRSFLAKSVPKRMAIISAGVIMNLIFAFLMAVVAFGIGTEEPPAVVSELLAGYPAWCGGNLLPGDEVLEIAGRRIEKYRDVLAAITLDDIDAKDGVPLLVRRPGVEKPFTVKVYRGHFAGDFKIGLPIPRSTKLIRDEKTWLIRRRHAVTPGTAAALAKPGFHNGDQIVQIDGDKVSNYGQIVTALTLKLDDKVAVTVARKEKDAAGQPTGDVRLVTIPVEPEPLRDLGLVMKMGRITAVQAHSPAAEAGIQVGDQILDPDGDPMTLPDRLLRQAGKTIEVKVERGTETKTFSLRLRKPEVIASSNFLNSPVEAAALGVTYRVLNEVDRVEPGSPADKAGMKRGDVLVLAKVAPPSKEALKALDVLPMDDLADVGGEELGFDDDRNYNWPLMYGALQDYIPGTTVELTYRRGKEQHTTEKMTPVDSTKLHSRDRGFCFEMLTYGRKGCSLGEALSLGGKETLDDVTVVFRSVKALGTNKVSPRKLAGPWTIIKMARNAADAGYAELLLFLTFLSANLAVINFMPIPVLDGGHFVLLAYEGIRGKPANETVQTVLAYIGLALIIALMVWVLGLDFGLISRQ
jgi:regulator of sigma E protease